MRALSSMLWFSFVWIAVLKTGFAQVRSADRLSPQIKQAVDDAVTAGMREQGVVGVALGLIQDGEIVYLQGYGQADQEQGTPVDEETVFNWASNSKPLLAVAAMQLVATNELDLDVDVRNYVPEYPDPGEVITLRHILCHQSGIPHYSNGRIVSSEVSPAPDRSPMDPLVAIHRFSRSPLLFVPGERVDYSSYAYVLASAVVQKAGGQPLLEQIETRISGPLEMKSLQLDVPFDGQPHWARGYVKGLGGQVIVARDEANAWKQGAGGYKSHIGDFAKWACALINGEVWDDQSQSTAWTRQPLNNGQLTNWGLGFVVEEESGRLKVSHGGSQREVKTRMVLYPQQRQGLVIMSNCQFADVGAISTAVFRAWKPGR